MSKTRERSLSTLSTESDSGHSDAAAATYMSSEFRQHADGLILGVTPLERLVAQADTVINDFAAHEQSRRQIGTKVIQLDRVMAAMLAYAEEAGGDEAKRYVAAILCATENDVEKLAAVGYTWLTHLLFIFKTSYGHLNQPNATPSPMATPTVDYSRTFIDNGAGYRQESFKDDVLLRDGYQCVISGYQDRRHPSPGAQKMVYLKACRILRRAIAVYGDNYRSKSDIADAATLDILLHFTRLSEETLGQLGTLIDDPSNGMLLQGDVHDGFNTFEWCLQGTEIPNQYTIKIFDERSAVSFLRTEPDVPVIFADRSSRFTHPASSNKRAGEIPLPNPDFLAIHAAIAGILHMSGAGKFFDELLDKYRDRGGSAPVLCWMDLEILMAAEEVRHVLTSSMAGIRVCT